MQHSALLNNSLMGNHVISFARACPVVRPNPAVNRTPAGVAGYRERFVGAGYLTRWAS